MNDTNVEESQDSSESPRKKKNTKKNNTTPKKKSVIKKKRVKKEVIKKLSQEEIDANDEQEFEDRLDFTCDKIHDEMHLAYGDFGDEEHDWLEESINNCMWLCGVLSNEEGRDKNLAASLKDFKKTQIQLHVAMLFGELMWIPTLTEEIEKYEPEEASE